MLTSMLIIGGLLEEKSPLIPSVVAYDLLSKRKRFNNRFLLWVENKNKRNTYGERNRWLHNEDEKNNNTSIN